jgi:hypothetical protein
VAEADPITILNQGSSSANVDVGFLFNRANGLVSNVALYWSESAQSIVTAYTASTGITNSNIAVTSYANLTVGNVLTVNGGIIGIVGNLTLGNLISNTGVYAVSSVTSGDAYVGGNLLVVGNITTLNREIVTSVEIVSGNLVANSGTASTNTTTGALVVAGGAGIVGDVNIGANLTYGAVPILESSRTVTSIGTAPVAIDWFASTAYRTAKYVISTTDVTNSWYQSIEIISVQDGTTSTISTYGLVSSTANARMTFSSNIVSGNVILWGTGVSANNTVKLVRTLIPV